MKRFIALAMLLAITAIVTTGCPRLVPIERKVADTPIESVAN